MVNILPLGESSQEPRDLSWEVQEIFSIKKEVEIHISDFVKFALAKRESEEVAELLGKLETANASFEAEKAESAKCKAQIASLLKEKSEYESKAKKETVDSLIATYASIMTKCGDFDEYRARIDYSKDTVTIEKELKEIYADYSLAKQRKGAAFAFNGVEAGRVANANFTPDPQRSRYGDAFDNIQL